MAPPHPLRRISTGSLSSLHRSQDRAHTSPSGLDFLQPALTELSDEASTLAVNISKLNELHDALGVFNESFAGLLYALKMNAFCVEWPEAPTKLSFERTPQYQAPEPTVIPQPPSPVSTSRPAVSEPMTAPAGDMTYATQHSFSTDDSPPRRAPVKKVAPKKSAAPGPAAKKAAMAARKQREAEIETVIQSLPLEYRGSQPSQRTAMEKIITMLMATSPLPASAMVSPPDLPPPRVNKCLIALVAKKVVTKVLVDGKTEYQWQGL